MGGPVAYFSMEIGLESAVPTYAGGLGVLAGDTIRATADLGIPMLAVSHGATWTAVPFQELYDRHVPEWRRQNLNLRYALGIPLEEIRAAHERAKELLLAEVQRRSGVRLEPARFTLGFARRATRYKRASLLFRDLARLRRMVEELGPLQVLLAGKAHPRDEEGKEEIRAVFRAASELGDTLPVAYLAEYDMDLARHLCAGADLWLNTPQKPREASGTSGMKAALNGVPSLSVLDGWWLEGHVEGVTGWAIGDVRSASDGDESVSLYDKLERVILPLYFGDRAAYTAVMRSAIALNGSFFNAERMLFQYAENAYGL